MCFTEQDAPGASPCPECGAVKQDIFYTDRKVGYVSCASGDHSDPAADEYIRARFTALEVEHRRLSTERKIQKERESNARWVTFKNQWCIKAPGFKTGYKISVMRKNGTRSTKVLGERVADGIFLPDVPKDTEKGACSGCGREGYRRSSGKIWCDVCVSNNRKKHARHGS